MGSSKMRCLIGSYLARQAPTYGDFADSWASPNDPIFFFHHANVDRHLMTWQQHHHNDAPYYNFPAASLPCTGHGLNDTVAPEIPFFGSLFGLDESDKALTNADIIAADGLAQISIYTYDTLSKGFISV